MAAVIGLLAVPATADVVMDWVTVGNPGNQGELSGEGAGGYGQDRICGAVAYVYNIGTYEVTNSQYTEFLNTVAGSDPCGLYNSEMASGYGGIIQLGSSPNYTYNLRRGRESMPVNYVSWYDALRFTNWMHNGQGSGDTEDGAYDMSLGSAVVRKPGAQVFLPNEDEWYKAAYYKGGGTDAGYWDYPTQSDSIPTAEAAPGTDLISGSANYNAAVGDLSDVGAYTYKPSDSAYGTFDQGGNLWELSETEVIFGGDQHRGMRGGSYYFFDGSLHAADRAHLDPMAEGDRYGFRIAAIPEPTTLSLLALGGLLAIRRRR